MKIILATHNTDKFFEMVNILDKLPIKILSLNDFPQIKEIIEDGKTLEENALIKAKTVYHLTGYSAWADDTGLEVDALKGDPGIFSARYAGNNCNYIDNINKLLKNMETVPSMNRTASFKTATAFVGEKMELVTMGCVNGIITRKPKGLAGFGYDPVFYIPSRGKTYSEMNIKEKNLISHRSKAINNMIKLLQSHIPNIFHKMEDVA